MSLDVTFVLLSCGESSENECLRSIEPFRDLITLIEIRDVFPQVKALNLMIESVQTEYFIPLDGDMVLYPDAWSRISNALRHHYRNPQWHSILFSLWDTLTERKILALKLMRSRIAKDNPFSESATPDVEHYKRLTDQGYTCIHDYIKTKPIGEHRVAGKKFCYAKYRDVYQTYKSHNLEWDSAVFMGGRTLKERVKSHFNFFLTKWLETNNRDYLHCIAGMMDGVLSETESKSKTLDFEYKIETNNVIDEYLRWQMNNRAKSFELI